MSRYRKIRDYKVCAPNAGGRKHDRSVMENIRIYLDNKAEARQARVPMPERCQVCDGTGYDPKLLTTPCLLESFYKCGECQGTGRRKARAANDD